MLLGFKDRFADRVERGDKTHTLRLKRKIRPRVGETAHCYTGLRRKGARLLGRFPVVKVDDAKIVVDRHGGWYVWINGEELSQDEREAFARRDGFSTANEMREFWIDTHNPHDKGTVYECDLIHWRYLAGDNVERWRGPGTSNVKPKARKRHAGGNGE